LLGGTFLAGAAQQVGDADIVQTQDPRWCGHPFSANSVGANGRVHAYARYGRGPIIYDGLDRDDVNGRIPSALRVVQLEYAQPVQAELPCNARVASLFVLMPSVNRPLAAGRRLTLEEVSRELTALILGMAGVRDCALLNSL